MKTPVCSTLILICLTLFAGSAKGDAIVVTKAMTASTIAEVFVLDDTVRVELEIGFRDLDGFRNLMPDAVYERLGHSPRPLAERLGTFFEQDLILRADGKKLTGRVVGLSARERIIRDEITGEPLPVGEDDGETVVYAEFAFELPGHPKTLSIQPPTDEASGRAMATIGFVAYHLGLPTNDFRYLGAEEILELDWEDPWYSHFRNRNLRRRYDSPISAFLYVDPFEVRKEIIIRPRDLQQWIDLGLAGKDTISVAEQPEIKNRIAAFLAQRSPVTIDGRTPEAILDRIHFVRRTLRRTGVIDPPQDLPVSSATLGVIFVYPIEELPQRVTMPWELFNERIQKVPSVATDEAGGLPFFLTPDDSILTWQNFLTNPTTPMLVDIAPPSRGRIPIPGLSVLCAIALIGIVIHLRRSAARSEWMIAVGVLLVAGMAFLSPYARLAVPNPIIAVAGVDDEGAAPIVSGLLTNVYRAFDYRDESVIYDALARSASGDLLTEIYLETRKALELQNQGGARVKVKAVAMESVDAEGLGDEVGFKARCRWNVSGSVGHWGHIHTRVNQYDAVLTVKPIDGVWKITNLELLEEQRIS